MNEEKFILEYEKLLDKGYCDCNEMNCIDNNSPRRILNIAKRLQQENQQLKEQLKQKEDIINKAIEYINEYAWQEDIIGDMYTTTGKSIVDKYMQLEWDNCKELLDILKEVE